MNLAAALTGPQLTFLNETMKSGRLLYGFLLTTALCVSACSMDAPKTQSSEDVLAAQGRWTLVEDRNKPDPVQANLEMRDKVMPIEDGLEPAKGEPVALAPPAEDLQVRVARLEQQMEAVQADVSVLMTKPKMLKTDKALAQVSAKTAYVQPKAVKKAMSGPLRVVGIRTGEYPGKSRFVIDLSNAAPRYSVDIDNAEKLMLVELPGTGWETQMSKTLSKSAFVKSYSVQKTDTGSRLAIVLKAPAKLAMNMALKPNHVHGHRIAFDLMAP